MLTFTDKYVRGKLTKIIESDYYNFELLGMEIEKDIMFREFLLEEVKESKLRVCIG